jgi:two-component system, NtrC family, sensor kinase
MPASTASLAENLYLGPLSGFGNNGAVLRHLGLRLQILLLLGGLLLLAFLPLLLAMATYTQVTLRQVDEEHTRALAAAMAARTSEAVTDAPSLPDVQTPLTGKASARGAPLVRMFALYAFLIALGVIILAYLALTHLIVRPLDQLSHAAQSVMLGSRQLAVPAAAAQELSELGESLKRMTTRLFEEEELLRRKVNEVELATEELKKAQAQVIRSERLASVGRLAAGLAHEVGNPIAALIGLLDLVIAGGLEPHEQQDFLKRMRSETERVNRTLKDLLQFARPTRSVSGQAPGPGDVEAAVHDTATLVLHQASMQGVELNIDVYPGLSKVTLAREQLVQVLLNLLINAADALEGKGNIWVRAQPERAGVGIFVEDDGPGIPAEVADQIFEPFFTTKEVGKGTGLGLSVCQALVAAAGGNLSLDRGAPRGARFTIWLPSAARGNPA